MRCGTAVEYNVRIFLIVGAALVAGRIKYRLSHRSSFVIGYSVLDISHSHFSRILATYWKNSLSHRHSFSVLDEFGPGDDGTRLDADQ